jgi:hypothetical protein
MPSKPDQHALDRDPHPSWRQGFGHRSRRNGAPCATDRRGDPRGSVHTQPALTPNAPIGGYYLNIDPDRTRLARYGLMVGDLQNMIAMALGAEPVTTTVEGRERYTVSIRYPRDYRSDPQTIATQVLITTAEGGTVPLGQVAKSQQQSEFVLRSSGCICSRSPLAGAVDSMLWKAYRAFCPRRSKRDRGDHSMMHDMTNMMEAGADHLDFLKLSEIGRVIRDRCG